MIRQSTSRNSDSKVSSATSAFLRFNLCFETFDTPIRRQSVKLPQISNKPIELDLPGRLFLIGKGSLKAGSQTSVKIEVWSYMDRSEVKGFQALNGFKGTKGPRAFPC